jgi:hypothetical protein
MPRRVYGAGLRLLIAFAVAAAGLSTLAITESAALPLAAAKTAAAVESDALLVRDGCGRGMRFSNRRQACVEDFNDGPQRFEGGRDFRRVDECGRGMRFSNSRQRCVWIDGGREPQVDAGTVAAGVALGVLGAAIGVAASNKNNNNNNRQGGGGPRRRQ